MAVSFAYITCVLQICVAAVGAGIVAKAGTAAKAVVASTSVGRKVLGGVAVTAKAAQRFKALSVDFAINAAKKASDGRTGTKCGTDGGYSGETAIWQRKDGWRDHHELCGAAGYYP